MKDGWLGAPKVGGEMMETEDLRKRRRYEKMEKNSKRQSAVAKTSFRGQVSD